MRWEDGLKQISVKRDSLFSINSVYFPEFWIIIEAELQQVLSTLDFSELQQVLTTLDFSESWMEFTYIKTLCQKLNARTIESYPRIS